MPILNIGLRLVTLGTRFLLNIFIVQALSLGEFGTYGLFATSISIGIIILGLDFYTYNLREVVKAPKKEQSKKLSNQFYLHTIVYVILLFILILLSSNSWVDIPYLALFIAILITEHLNQEIYRIMITLGKPLFSNFLFFLRSASWGIIFIISYFLGSDIFTNLNSIFWLWFSSNIVTLFIAVRSLRRMKYSLKPIKKDFIRNIYTGLKVSVLFFIGTIGLKIVEFSGRYIADLYVSKEEVGVLIFYQNMSNLVSVLVYSGVTMIIGPKILQSKLTNNLNEASGWFKKLWQGILTYSFVSILIIAAGIYPLLSYMEKPLLEEHLHILWILLLSSFFFNLSYFYHYKLYASLKDKPIVTATLISAFINIALTLTLIQPLGIFGIAISSLFSYASLLLLKSMYAKKNLSIDS